MKWLIIIIIIMVLIGMNNQTKKEGKFTFRCSEDKKSIELLNKESQKFVTYQSCNEGKCEIDSGIPTCIQPEAKKEEGFNNSYLFGAAILFLLIFKKKIWRN